MNTDKLHSALNTRVVKSASGNGVNFQLVRMQYSKSNIAFGLHADPNSYTMSGIQRTDVLAWLDFERSHCAFQAGGQCYVREVPESFDVDGFAKSFDQVYSLIDNAEKHFEKCGILLQRPEGWGYFHGKESSLRQRQIVSASGDGHTASKIEKMKECEDDIFHYKFTWLEGNEDRGWTIHYRPKHPPISPEVWSAMRFVSGFSHLQECPQFEFEPCYWRFIPFEPRGDSFFEGNAEFAHRSFEGHKDHFSEGIKYLLEAHKNVARFGIHFLDISPSSPETIQRGASNVATTKLVASNAGGMPAHFHVAISFAGSERHLAEELATMVKTAGYEVFYDDFYKEHLWGKDLPKLFDDIYRKRAKYCVIFVSKEYADRIWTDHERKSAQARAMAEKGNEYVLPIQVDGSELPGFAPTIGYLSLSAHTMSEIGKMLISKLKS